LEFLPQKLQYYLTAEYPCSYLEGCTARSQVVTPGEVIDTSIYSQLIARGFRRSGAFIYRPQCDNCRACMSLRVPALDFIPNRSQKRAWQQHAGLTCVCVKPVFSEEHFALFTRYQKARHAGGGMDVDDAQQYTDFLIKSHVASSMVEFRQVPPDRQTDELKMVSIIDQIDDGLSSVYTFYTPEPGQNLGTFNVLWQIQQARLMGLRYVYLGYWIGACAKMSYKGRFKPCELLVNGEWQRVDSVISQDKI
jgi:arginine-tRNA-protein transferase